MNRCESTHVFPRVVRVPFRCLGEAGHEGPHYAWLGYADGPRHLYWDDAGHDFDDHPFEYLSDDGKSTTPPSADLEESE